MTCTHTLYSSFCFLSWLKRISYFFPCVKQLTLTEKEPAFFLKKICSVLLLWFLKGPTASMVSLMEEWGTSPLYQGMVWLRVIQPKVLYSTRETYFAAKHYYPTEQFSHKVLHSLLKTIIMDTAAYIHKSRSARITTKHLLFTSIRVLSSQDEFKNDIHPHFLYHKHS